ncbi:MAG: hypothetical protein K2X93_04450 [Candidatus Obscuribacterales bacterium]|nr:hypothetical protein [Candidatus Obscuribacterales bacterium]
MGDLFKRRISTTIEPSTIRIGEFLGLIEVLSPEILDETLQAAEELEVPVGRATVLRGLITNGELSKLIQLHCLVKGKIIGLEEAREAFFISRRENWPIKESLVALGCSTADGTFVRIGELLIESERVSEQDLRTSLELQGLCGLPLGRILTIDARIPEIVVNEALALQADIRDRRRTYREAIVRLRRFRIAEDAFAPRKRLLLNRQTLEFEPETMELRDILIAAEVVTEEDLKPAEHFAVSNNLLLEDVLRSFPWIDHDMLSAASAAAGFIKYGYITGDEAVSVVKSLKSNDETLDALPHLATTVGKSMTLYQFLVTSGFLTPEGIRQIIRTLMNDSDLFLEVIGRPRSAFSEKRQVKHAIIKSILENENLERSLAEVQKADRKLISYSRDLLSLISHGIITVDQAILSFARLRYEKGERAATPERVV